MRFLELRIRNFLSFRDEQVIDLRDGGLICVTGVNHDSKAADSNGCLSGDTLIDGPRDLIRYPKGVPIKDLVGTRPWVYCWVDGRITIRRASEVWLTEKNAPVVRVRLSKYATNKGGGNGGKWLPPQELVGTADHLVLLADGVTWRALGDLVPGDRVCSLYRRQSGGWRTLIHWTGQTALSEQQFVCSILYGPRPDGCQVHHLNENSFDHSVDNVEWKNKTEHLSDHTRERNLRRELGWQKHGKHPKGFLGKNHTTDTRRRISETLKRSRFPNNHTVLSVEDADKTDVYDMHVPGANNFVANGVVVHNSGKSSLVEALLWCLWGTTLRKLKADEVIHQASASDCLVSTKLEDESGQIYEITRTRRDSSSRKTTDLTITIDGKSVTLGVNADTQVLVTAILGMDADTFTQSVLLSTGTRSFCDMTDAEQKGVLDDILQLDHLTAARKTVRTQISKKQHELASVTSRIETLEQQKNVHESQAIAAQQRRDDYALSQRRKRYQLEGERTLVFLKMEALCRAHPYTEARQALDKAEEDYHDAECQNQELSKTLNVRANEGMQERRLLDEKLKRLDDRRRQVEQDTHQMNGLAGAPCPTCKQMVSPDVADSYLALWDKKRNKIDDLADKIVALFRSSEDRENKDVVELSAKLVDHKEALQRAIDQCSLMRDQLVRAKTALESLPDLEEDADRISRYIRAVRGEENPHDAIITVARANVILAQKEIAVERYRQRSLDLEIQHLVFWDQGFGNQGIRSYLLDSVTPFLTERAQRYADIMSGGDLSIRFDAQTQLKGGKWKDQLNVEVKNSQGADVYRGNSSGEKRRSDIAVGWALGDLAATRAHKPIRFKGLDEPFESLDETGEDAVIKLLYAVLSDYETVLCMTHSNHLRSQFPKEICVIKENGFSRIQSP